MTLTLTFGRPKQTREVDYEPVHSLDDPGFCLLCGEDAYGVEPDARKYPCEHCGQHTVYGAEELLFMGRLA